MSSNSWPKKRDLLLIKLHGTGIPYSQIANEIGAQFGLPVSRNACIGRARRLGLGGTVKLSAPVARTARGRPVEEPIPAKLPWRPAPPVIAAPPVTPRCAEVVPRHLSLADLQPSDCRFPYGDRGFTFCGHPKTAGSSYCLAHFQLTRKADVAKIRADPEASR